ncbi:MAG: biosynthetic-type acetolactate synthase large subunit [Thermoleophilia bacterium]
MKMKGSEAIVASLEAEGCEVVFGFPGGTVIPLYDALLDAALLRHVLVHHEQGAVHAADGYARATGKVGVCMATSGPGATNLITGIANAYLDSIPLVAITGQVKADLIGTDAFQEADVTGITLPIVKHSYLVKKAADLPQVIHEAFHIAGTGRPGPVVIDVPITAQLGELTYSRPVGHDLPGYKPTVKGHIRQIRAAAKALREAERPVLYVGGGAITAGAAAELLELAELAQAPVTTTHMGLGAFPGRHALSLGPLGMHGTVTANYAVHECDLLCAIGARFDDRVTGKLSAFAPQAKTIVHIDVDPAEIGKNVEPTIPIVGDAKAILAALVPELREMQPQPGRTADWLAKIARWKAEFPLHYEHEEGTIAPQFVIEEIDRVTGGDAVICTDVGQHQMWATLYYQYSWPRQWISSGGLGTMGFGLPAAMGAKVGRPDKTVIDISGDGGFQMTMQELATCVNYNIPVVVAMLNNGYLGMVRQWQDLFWNKRYSHTDIERQPDFAKLADAFGALGMTVTSEDQVGDALRDAIASNRPTLIDFRVRREENVFPMVPAGASITEMIGGKAPRRKKP